MKKPIIAVFVLMTMFSLNSETYSVKYKNEFGNTERAYYTVTEEDKEEISPLAIYALKVTGTKVEVIDEDSDLDDLAIVKKLDKQGYKSAAYEFIFGTLKFQKLWFRKDNIWYVVRSQVKGE